MVSRPFRDECNYSRLKTFLDDGLPEPENVQLAEHLNHCEACRRTLERLAAGSRLWAELRQAFPTSHSVQPPARRGSEPHGTLPHGASEPEGEVPLDFLEPPANEDSLGRLGSYEVTGVLGRGGFGVVLKARDLALGRTVAIKVLAPQLAVSGVARARFAREARAAAAVVHDNVVAIHAVDAWNGLPYLVMPFIAGQSLQERVDRDGPLAIKEVLRIGMQAALGLAAAHAQGLVHRDVKPSNILLENGLERVKLCDFGMARAVDDASLTQSGVVSGTPQYMSAEQARGEAADHRSDLFALGSVLYFMCAGHPPFRADSTPAVLRRVSDERPRPLREINIDVPVWLAEIIGRLHAKEPGGRFQSATEVAEVLQHHLSELQRTGTSMPLRQAPIRKRANRKPAIALAFSGMLILAAIFGGVFLSSAGKQSPNAAGRNPLAVTIEGSGRSASKTWELADFNEVSVREGFQAEIVKGDGFRVTTTSDDNVIEHLEVVREGATLKIGLKPNRNIRRKQPLTAAITMPKLQALSLRDGSKGVLKDFRNEQKIKLSIRDGSRLEGGLAVADADFDIHDGSHLTLTGSAKNARLSVHDGSHLKLQDFVLKQGSIKVADGSRAALTVKSDKPFQATVANSATLDGSVEASELDLKARDTGRVTLQGSAKRATIEGHDASRIHLSKFPVDDAKVTLTDTSRADVDVRKSLRYSLSSNSSVEYAGAPASVTGSKTGGARIRQHPRTQQQK
jgi:serine/threonine-protein kinase